MRARVWAIKVLPQPVGPINKMLDFDSSTSPSRLFPSSTLVVVVDRNGQDPLRLILSDDVVVQEGIDLARRWQLTERNVGGVGEFFFDDLVAEINALVADVDAGAGDQFLDLLCDFPQNGTSEFSTSPNLATQSPPQTSADGRDRPAVIHHITRFDDLIDDPVLLCLVRGHDEVTIGVGGDLLDGLAGVMSQHLFEAGFHSLDLSGDELNVGRLPCAPA